jgi:hypothetical protein
MIFFDKFTFWLAQKCFITWSLSSFEADKSAFSSWYSFLPCHSPLFTRFNFNHFSNFVTFQKCPNCATSTPFWTSRRSIRSSTTSTTSRSRCRTRKALLEKLANSEVKDDDSNSVETILENPAETKMTWVPKLEVPFSERLGHAKQDVLEAEFLLKEAQDLVDVWGTAVRLIKSANAKIFDLVMKI